MKVSEIKVGTRHRKNLGDLDKLAESLQRVGRMLAPVVVNSSGELIVGERRLAAAKRIGWKEVPAIVAEDMDDVHKALLAERDENECREPFLPSEAVAMAKALEPYEREAAAERMREANPGGKTPSVKFTEGSKGETRQRIAEAVGVSAPILARAAAVVDAAKTHPDHYADIAEEMDRTGKVTPAYKKLAERQAEPQRPKVALPHKIAVPDVDPFPDHPIKPGPEIHGNVLPDDPVEHLLSGFHDVLGIVNGLPDVLAELRESPKKKRSPLAAQARLIAVEFERIAKELES